MVVCFNKKHLDNFGSERFFKNPLSECSLYHSWTLLSKHHHYRGMGTMLALHICVLPLKTAILCHMTSKRFVQTKDNEMYECIKFRVLIS